MKKENEFLTGINMGEKTFTILKENTINTKLYDGFEEIIQSFKRHKESIKEYMMMHNITPATELPITSRIANYYEFVKVNNTDDDFKILIEGIKAINMGIIQGLKFIHENKGLNSEFLDLASGVVKDYDNHLSKLKYISSELN